MKLRFLLPLLVLLAHNLPAEILVGFVPKGFSKGGPSPWTSEARIELAPGVKLDGGLQRGPGVRSGGTSDAWGGNGFDGTSKEEALSKESWFLFTLSPEAGRTISYGSLQASFFRAPESASNYQWQYRIGSGEFRDLKEPETIQQSSVKGIEQPPISLSSIPNLQNTTEPVTFRMLGWGATKTSASWGFGKTTGLPVLVVEGAVGPAP